LTAVKLNPYILKVKLDLNPTRSNMLKEIQANTASNILKVSEQEIPQFSKEIKEV